MVPCVLPRCYGIRWKMWSPNNHLLFPTPFQDVVKTMIMASRRTESLMYLLQDEIVHFIMNKCHWDDFGRDPPGGLRGDSDEEGGASSSAMLTRGVRGSSLRASDGYSLGMPQRMYNSYVGQRAATSGTGALAEPTAAMRAMCEEILSGHFGTSGWDSDSGSDDEYAYGALAAPSSSEEASEEASEVASGSDDEEDEEDKPVVVDLD